MNIFRDNRSINGAARRLVEFESALFCRTYPRLASRSAAIVPVDRGGRI